jgi:exodeoxyribonuclease VII small subunit
MADDARVMRRDTPESNDDCSFEEALARLEEVVRSLETKELALKESVRLFQEAMGLVKVCQNRLNEAQHSIEEIEVDFEARETTKN